MSNAPPPEDPIPTTHSAEENNAPEPARVTITPVIVSSTVTYSLLALTGIVFLLQTLSTQLLGADLPVNFGLKVNELIEAGEIWRLFTPMFLHGSIPHFLFNMYALYIFGRNLEPYYGHLRFLALYLVSGFAGNVLSMVFTEAPSLGSSTAIYGLFGAQAIFLYQNRKMMGTRGRRALSQLATLLVINILISFSPGIDMWGHLGGLIAGGLFAWFSGPVLEVDAYSAQPILADSRPERHYVGTAVWVTGVFTILALATILVRIGLF